MKFIPFLLAALIALPALAQPVGGAGLDFPVQDDAAGTLRLRAMLWLPAAPPAGGVVLLHGAGGWNDFREGHYGRLLSGAGYAVLAVDSHGPRGVPQTMNHMQVSFAQLARDAMAARQQLVDRGVPARRIAVLGLSKGGTGALYAMDRFLTPAQAERFAAVVALYPPCHVRARTAMPTAPVFIGLGEKDDLTGVQQCQDTAAALRAAGGNVTVKVYPSSAHGFDGNPDSTVSFYAGQAETFTRCNVEVEADGRETYRGQTYPPGGAEIMAALRATCVRKGASFWTNPAQKAAAAQDIVQFLATSMPP